MNRHAYIKGYIEKMAASDWLPPVGETSPVPEDDIEHLIDQDKDLRIQSGLDISEFGSGDMDPNAPVDQLLNNISKSTPAPPLKWWQYHGPRNNAGISSRAIDIVKQHKRKLLKNLIIARLEGTEGRWFQDYNPNYNPKDYLRGASKNAGFSDTIRGIISGKGLGLTPDTGTSLPIDNRWVRSALVGAIPGAAINLYRNWDNEDQSKLKSLMYGAGTGAMAGLGAQALLPNGLPFNRPDSARYERNTNYNKVDSAQPVIDEQMQRSSPHPQYINSSMQRMLGGPTATA